ncbi:hypothetical protein NSQ77_14635 [Oceanobacillus sp. FSL K6-2867]|uniref:hypothetical protein n=1 Tax=Oceanobacillus sp. FSL K6-2867 TaxID=2954748 RepID=UPI0030D70BEA
MSKRKRNYLETLAVIFIFILVIFIFDLPKMLLLTAGIGALVSIFLYEMFGFRSK